MGGGDAATEGLDPGQGIGAAADDPGHVHFPFQVGAALQDLVHRHGAIGAAGEFEVMVVPAEAQPGGADRGAGLLQAGAEGLPVFAIGRAVLRHDMGAVDLFHPHGMGDAHHEIG